MTKRLEKFLSRYTREQAFCEGVKRCIQLQHKGYSSARIMSVFPSRNPFSIGDLVETTDDENSAKYMIVEIVAKHEQSRTWIVRNGSGFGIPVHEDNMSRYVEEEI